MKKLVLVGFVSALLAGCSTTLPVSSYTPQNHTRFTGEVNLGEFRYLPFEKGLVKSNQMQNTAVGQIFTSSNIADLAQRGTALELEKTGINLNNSNIQLSGIVKEFKMDDLGYSMDWSYIINYKITNLNTSAVLLDKDYVADARKTGKFGLPIDYANSANDMILSGYNKFITDPDVKIILEKK
ncbi:integrase [Bibersteinia trehalosi]|uniref:integrase n=1 Tax=Bibersteinia trehalosi TaxID=47735 RepID=UPI002D7806B8|nr:integrase [Bibersteinia trehalosi]